MSTIPNDSSKQQSNGSLLAYSALSTAAGGAAGYGAYKLSYGSTKSEAQKNAELSQDEFIKSEIKNIEKENANNPDAIKSETEKLLNSADSSFKNFVDKNLKEVAECKKVRNLWVAAMAITAGLIYGGAKMLSDRKKQSEETLQKPMYADELAEKVNSGEFS